MSNLPTYQQWMFGRVQEYVEYKAAEYGISVVYVNPQNTSKGCSHTDCQTVSESHRSHKRFECSNCGRSWNADYNAARNIGLRYIFDSLLPASQTCSPGKATSQLALISGILSVTEHDVNHVSQDWMSTDKPTA
jgi:transposase, IS605 OrfB family, central region